MAIDILRAQREFRSKFSRAGQGVTARVSSFWRTAAHNREVGGAAMSQHQYGLAADVTDFASHGHRERFKRQARAAGLVVVDEGDHVHVQLLRAGDLGRQGIVGPKTAFDAPARAWRYRL